MDQSQEESKEDEKNNSNNKQKQKRRTRHDPNHRDFLCGCGRAYLSYPALYTHIKQKHDGVPPEGTAIPQDRGRSVQKAQLNNQNVSNPYLSPPRVILAVAEHQNTHNGVLGLSRERVCARASPTSPTLRRAREQSYPQFVSTYPLSPLNRSRTIA